MNQVSYGKGSAGGSSNESGSLHRAGVAAVLAVHGLLNQPVSTLPGKVPVEIRLETLDATDDIACGMSDGSTWFIQAKRNVGFDKALRSTIEQWSKQPVKEKDSLVLAASTFKGDLSKLQPALDRLSMDPNAILNPLEEKGRTLLLTELEAIAPGRGQQLFRSVRLLQCPVERETDASFAHAAAMLDGALVAIGTGRSAFRSLRAYFQAAAADRRRTSPQDWIQALNADDIEVFADAKGVTGSRERARVLALREYRDAWRRRLDRLDLSLLLDSVPEVHIEGLASNYQISWQQGSKKARTANLYTTIRRNDRFIVTGLPGMGKSSALVQIAAALASDDAAPVPVLLDLKGIGQQIHTPSDINVPRLMSQASKLGVETDPTTLEAALHAEVVRGNVIFLVDGLDETLDKATITAAGLADLLPRLHPKCGFILTTRSNALVAAQQTGLTQVELVTPENLFESLRTLLEAMSPIKDPNRPQQWLAGKVAWLEKSMNHHKDIWEVPLLATLTTFRAADGDYSSPNAASLLNQVIQDSVKKWEYRRKSSPPGGNDRELRPEMLIDGFAAIGHALNSHGPLPIREAEKIIVDGISRWGFSEPLTEELARQILWFWDNSVGIFIEVNGQVQARSRQFAELGDAYWACASTRRSSWLTTALNSSSKREAVKIAAITDAHMAQDLLDQAENNPDADARCRALSWMSDLSRDRSVTLDDVSTRRLFKLLGNAAKEGMQFDDASERSGLLKELFDSVHAAQHEADGDGWVFTYRLATFPTTPPNRVCRDSVIGTLQLDDARLKLVEALASLSDSDFDGQAPLTESDVEKIREILKIPIPPQLLPPKVPGQPLTLYAQSFHPITGTADVAAGAAARIELFQKDMPATLYALAKALPHGKSEAITEALRLAGHPDPAPWELGTMFEEFQRQRADLGGWGWLVRTVASLPDEDSPDDSGDRWRWRALADLIDALDYTNASIPGFSRAATEDHKVIVHWIDAISTAGSIDRAAIVVQARSLLKLAEHAETDAVTDLIDEPRLERIVLRSRQLSHEQSLAVVPALLSHSDWISRSAANLLIGQKHARLADAIRSSDKKLTPTARWLSSVVLCTNADLPSADVRDLLATDDPPQRTAAAFYLRKFHEAELEQYWETALIDDDLSVRYAAGAIEVVDPQPKYWSCRWCSSKNQIEDTTCRKCDLSSKPSARDRDDAAG
ncbi:NACHT domain-containing protein [Glutamicibacter ardleyensis]|uniref:NACHT domain-containing protein n=1 Tax=Glutamicibacter ardleyensis TaxID=225894 RepID=A0ABQ2DNM5_9MICC|nr:NACHT domain-containing protein [Glutamicibacter ardleyensis]GGJ65867.1 hypothetical protein GCM10007173_25950 [Glutamicibacter ardleyensis]